MSKIKNPKNAGRKKLFLREQFNYIIDNYLLDGGDTAIASKIADYAKKNKYKFDFPNIEKIEGRHFRDDEKIKERLDNMSYEKQQKFADTSILAFQSYDINSFVDRNIKNPLKLKNELLNIQIGQKAMYKKMVNQEVITKELKSKIDIEAFEDVKINIKELKNENKELKEIVAKQRALVDVDNHLMMCKFIWENTFIEATDLVDQYITTLLKCKVIIDSDVEAMKLSDDCIIVDEDEEEEDKIVEFSRLADKKIQIEEKAEDDIESNEGFVRVDLNALLGYNDEK